MINIETATAYQSNTVMSTLGNREIRFTSSTPRYDEQKMEKIHDEIERGLYAVFAKYIPTS